MRWLGKAILFGLLFSSVLAWGEPAPLVLNPRAGDRLYHLAVGVSYTGFQLRYQFSSKWAAEARYQFGKAESNYGDVQADVFGLRGYRFIPYRRHLSWYVGAEAAHAHAKANDTN